MLVLCWYYAGIMLASDKSQIVVGRRGDGVDTTLRANVRRLHAISRIADVATRDDVTSTVSAAESLLPDDTAQTRPAPRATAGTRVRTSDDATDRRRQTHVVSAGRRRAPSP